MHMADFLVSPAVSASMYGVSALATGYSVRKLKLEQDAKKIPMMGIMGAFVFASQMINFTIPGTGSSGHLTGGLLLSALIGPYAGFITMVVNLIIQCLLFADGGLLALGCNIWNMAFYACFFGYFCIYKPILNKGFSRRKIVIASLLGSILSLQLGAFSVCLETLASGVTDLPFKTFVLTMQPIHFVIGLVEGLITSAVLIFIYQSRPELLDKKATENRIQFQHLMAILSIIVVLIGGGLSLIASNNADGLEWSIGKVAGASELDSQGEIYESAAIIQNNTAVLPDYSFGSGVLEKIGTSFSGITGSMLVAVVCIGGSYCFRYIKKKRIETIE